MGCGWVRRRRPGCHPPFPASNTKPWPDHAQWAAGVLSTAGHAPCVAVCQVHGAARTACVWSLFGGGGGVTCCSAIASFPPLAPVTRTWHLTAFPAAGIASAPPAPTASPPQAQPRAALGAIVAHSHPQHGPPLPRELHVAARGAAGSNLDTQHPLTPSPPPPLLQTPQSFRSRLCPTSDF